MIAFFEFFNPFFLAFQIIITIIIAHDLFKDDFLDLIDGFLPNITFYTFWEGVCLFLTSEFIMTIGFLIANRWRYESNNAVFLIILCVSLIMIVVTHSMTRILQEYREEIIADVYDTWQIRLI